MKKTNFGGPKPLKQAIGSQERNIGARYASLDPEQRMPARRKGISTERTVVTKNPKKKIHTDTGFLGSFSPKGIKT